LRSFTFESSDARFKCDHLPQSFKNDDVRVRIGSAGRQVTCGLLQYLPASMTSKQQRAREIQRLIADVLRRNWDPIGIRDMPGTEDEYGGYVAGVYRLLVSGASVRELSDHLAQVETDALGFADEDPKMLIPVAKKLLNLNVKL
jgi:hypothetical protein